MALLSFLKGANAGSTIELMGDKIILGRNQDCNVVLNVPAVSREHAVIRRIQGKFYIEDMKSRNGTFVNNKEISTRTLLKDNDKIKICDNFLAFFENAPKAPLPEEMRRDGETEEDEEDSSTVEATLSGSSKQILEAQPAEKLAMLLELSADLSQTFNLDSLLPKIVDSLFQVFRQADRGFVIMADEGKLIPKVTKARRAGEDDSTPRFSRRIINRCLESGQSILSEDASADKQFDLAQSIADARIRSVMLAPLIGRASGRAFGVIQLDTQDRMKKFTQDDLKLLLAVAAQAAVAIENARMHETLVARAGLERDLMIARQVQMSFLPKKLPQLPGYDFFAHYESAQEVGGDYYDFIPLPDVRMGVMVGDVAGKGMPAALLMAKISSDARYCSLTEKSLADVVYKLNEQMQEASMLDRFVTLSAMLLDPARHAVTFASAGHNPPLLYRKLKNTFEEATPRDLAGFPLGVADGIPFESMSVDLEPGDCLIQFTDGVLDAKNRDEKDFGHEGILQALVSGPPNPLEMGQRLVGALKQHTAGRKAHDDVTIVCFGRQ
ncbi:MAG: SpoIIE family protein phosphatase [Gemmataceae bacterium]|nr:SpoIIE family protein phosphatase [Gemmataceae bacterium]